MIAVPIYLDIDPLNARFPEEVFIMLDMEHVAGFGLALGFLLW